MDTHLDRIDFEILGQLQNDARLSNKELAARVHLAPSSCLQRVRRLFRIGAITGTHAAVEPRILGIEMQAMIAVRLQVHAADLSTKFFDDVSAHPAVIAVYYLAGAIDFQVHVAVRDTEALRRLVGEFISARPGVAHVETSLIFDYRRTPVLPRYIGA